MEHQELAASSLSFGTYISVEPDFTGVPEFAREAEDLGYQRLSLGEHLMDGNPPRPTVLSIPALAAAGGATSRIRLLAGVVLIPLYEPVMLAKLASTLDIVTGGRLEFGIGIGGQRDTYAEYDAVGIPVGERGRRADEILRLIMRLWTEAHVSFEGPLLPLSGRHPGASSTPEAPSPDMGRWPGGSGHAPRRTLRRWMVPLSLHPAPLPGKRRSRPEVRCGVRAGPLQLSLGAPSADLHSRHQGGSSRASRHHTGTEVRHCSAYPPGHRPGPLHYGHCPGLH